MRRMALLTTTVCFLGTSSVAQEQAPSPAKSLVKIGLLRLVKIEPTEGTALKAGSKVRLKARVWYRRVLGGKTVVALIVQDQDRQLLGTMTAARTRQREGELQLTVDVHLPAEGVSAVHAGFLLFAEGAAQNSGTSLWVEYQVER